jgi:hypothetical protein
MNMSGPHGRPVGVDAGAQPARLPPTEFLLVSDGDARIALGDDGTNIYGCPPWPDPALLDFGSSTASVISSGAFEAAAGLRKRLYAALPGRNEAELYATEMQRLRGELLELCGLEGDGSVDVLFAASGTDLHRMIAEVVAASGPSGLFVLGPESAETGSGVAVALTEGGGRGAACAIEVAGVALRDAYGRPRRGADIDAEAEAKVAAAVAAGQRVLLVLVDVSKTGLIAPSPACAMALQRRWPESVEVMVDACQFRLAPATLHAYLEQGFIVALTGSKFVGGPSFSGAVLVPRAIATRLRGVSTGFRHHAVRAELPADWAETAALEDGARFGRLLRWEAALYELRAFRRLPADAVVNALRELTEIVDARLQRDPAFEALARPALDRRPLAKGADWDGQATIFPFLLFRPQARRRPLGREQTRRVYELLQGDLGDSADWLDTLGGLAVLRCRVGQPVACGQRDGIEISALRLCFGARLLAEAASGEDALLRVAGRAMACLDKCARLAAAVAD